MTPHAEPNDVPPSAFNVHQDLVAARRKLEWEMAQKLFTLASHLILRLRVDPSSCRSSAQISSLLELASRFARLACDAPQPTPASPPDSGSLSPEFEAALARVYGPATHPAPSSSAEIPLTSADLSAATPSKADSSAVALAKADQP